MRQIKAVLSAILIAAMLITPMAAVAAKVNIGRTVKKTAVYGGSFRYPVAVVPQGDPVIYKSSGKAGYYSVVTVDGTTGYISKAEVKHAGAVDSKYVGTMRVTTTMYKYSGGKMRACAVLDAGMPVLVTGAKNGLAQIRTLRGMTGYVKTADIRRR